LQSHCTDWPLVCKDLPNRSVVQIKSHARTLFDKIKKVMPRNSDVYDFIKSKPAEFWVPAEASEEIIIEEKIAVEPDIPFPEPKLPQENKIEKKQENLIPEKPEEKKINMPQNTENMPKNCEEKKNIVEEKGKKEEKSKKEEKKIEEKKVENPKIETRVLRDRKILAEQNKKAKKLLRLGYKSINRHKENDKSSKKSEPEKKILPLKRHAPQKTIPEDIKIPEAEKPRSALEKSRNTLETHRKLREASESPKPQKQKKPEKVKEIAKKSLEKEKLRLKNEILGEDHKKAGSVPEKEKILKTKSNRRITSKRPCIRVENEENEYIGNDSPFISAINIIKNNEPMPISTQVQVNGEKQINSHEIYKMIAPPPTLLPSEAVSGSLHKLLIDLVSFGQRLEIDYEQRAHHLNNNMELGEYWRALQECSESLLHIVNDITLMHQHDQISSGAVGQVNSINPQYGYSQAK